MQVREGEWGLTNDERQELLNRFEISDWIYRIDNPDAVVRARKEKDEGYFQEVFGDCYRHQLDNMEQQYRDTLREHEQRKKLRTPNNKMDLQEEFFQKRRLDMYKLTHPPLLK